MSGTTRGRRSDALYYSELSRRILCDMIARLEEPNVAKAISNDEEEPSFLSDAWGAEFRCGGCGFPVMRGDRYCSRCGAEIDWGER